VDDFPPGWVREPGEAVALADWAQAIAKQEE